MIEPSARPYDVVLFGATGFTGGLTAEVLARRSAQSSVQSSAQGGEMREGALRWAIAGRNRDKLEALRRRLLELVPGASKPALVEASAGDSSSLERLASSARVVATTVGPYERHGERLVRACVEQGTHYADITGEPAFVDRMIESYDAAARRQGLRLVCCCGFDSVPHDLGALLAVRQLPVDEAIELRAFVQAAGGISGGTWSSAVQAMGETRILGARGTRGETRHSEPSGEGARRVRRGDERIHYEKHFGEWVVPMPTIDPQVVLRSARALTDYGPDFRYGHFARVGSLPRLVATVGTVGGIFALAKIPPTRALLLRLKGLGSGPSEARRAASHFRVTFLGRAGSQGAERELVEVRGGDPGYDETAKMLAESALCLAFDGDRLPAHAGVLTPAVAMGDALLERLQAAGMVFEVKAAGEA